MKLYRLYTENTGQTPEEVAKLLRTYGFDGATILHGMGVYKGQIEKTLIIEIAGYETDFPILQDMAYHILDRWTPQKSVMLVSLDGVVEFATKDEAEE